MERRDRIHKLRSRPQQVIFQATQTERLAKDDPRLSSAERYKNDGQHVSQVARTADRLVRQRLLLEEDVAAIITEAAESDVGK